MPHGQWAEWVEKNTAVSPRTASTYQQVARFWDQADQANRQRVADLSLRSFLDEIAGSSFQLPRYAPAEGEVTIYGSPDTDAPQMRPLTSNGFEKKAAWIEAESEMLKRRSDRIRKRFEGGKFVSRQQQAVERQIDMAILSSTETNTLAAVRLLATSDPETLARVSLLDETVNLEELASIVSDAASRALEIQKRRQDDMATRA